MSNKIQIDKDWYAAGTETGYGNLYHKCNSRYRRAARVNVLGASKLGCLTCKEIITKDSIIKAHFILGIPYNDGFKNY